MIREFNSPSGTRVIIRRAVAADAKNIIAYSTHILSTFREFVLTTPEEFTSTEEEQQRWIERHNNSPAAFLALAEAGGLIVGMIHLEAAHRKKAAHTGEFALSVREGWHNQKIGSELLKCLIDWGRKNDSLEKIILNVSADNHKAIHLYKKLGFEQEGYNKRAVKQAGGRYTDNIQMALFV